MSEIKIRREKTGIDIIDNLSDEEYRLAKQTKNALTQQQKVKHLVEIHNNAREKIRQYGCMITHREAVAEYYNFDFPRKMEQVARQLEQNGHLDAAREVRLSGRRVMGIPLI